MKILLRFLLLLIFLPGITNAQFLEWPFNTGGPGGDEGYFMARLTDGFIYTTGQYELSVDFDPGPGVNIQTAAGARDIFITKHDSTGNLIWVRTLGEPLVEYGLCVTTDIFGNVLVTGQFSGTLDFDPSPQTFNLTSQGGSDIFVLKLDPSGNFLWAKTMGGTGYDYGSGIVTDILGNVIVTGNFYGSADFNSDTSVSFPLTAMGGKEIFILKLDMNGNFILAKRIGGALDDNCYSLAYHNSGYILLSGNYSGTVDFDPGPGAQNLSSQDVSVFILKMDLSVNLVWVRSTGNLGSTAADFHTDLSLASNGDSYLTGAFTGTADLNTDPSGTLLVSSFSPLTDIYIIKLNDSGNFIWAKNIGGSGFDSGTSIANFNNSIYITGVFGAYMDFDPGPGIANTLYFGGYDIFVLNLDSAGIFQWVEATGSVNNDVGVSVLVSNTAAIYLMGYFEGTMDADPGPGNYILTANDIDLYILKWWEVITAIEDEPKVSRIELYPNPTSGQFSLQMNKPYEIVNIEIRDCLGRLISNQTHKNNFTPLSFLIEGASGFYNIKVTCDSSAPETFRIIKNLN